MAVVFEHRIALAMARAIGVILTHRQGRRRPHRAAIFIPFGAATDSHQLRNAQEMARAGAGRVIPETDLTAERLTSEIFSLLDQPREIARQSTAARSLARPDAARDIVNLIEEVARPRG